jgi:hypothetical protein
MRSLPIPRARCDCGKLGLKGRAHVAQLLDHHVFEAVARRALRDDELALERGDHSL